MKQKLLALLLAAMAFAVSTDMRADWTQKDVQVRTTVTSVLSAQQQHITIRYPEENYVGFYNDGVYNVTIATPDGVVYKKDRPNKNAAPATAGAYGYMCFDRCEDAEEDKSSSGTDTRYRNVDICMKSVTTLDEYLNFWVRVQFDLYIDCTGDTPKGTPIHVDKTFGYAELSAENLQLPEIKSIQWQYGEPKSTLMIQASDLTNGWTPIISYYDSKDKDTEIMNWALPTFIAKFDDVGEYDRDRTAILYKVARKEFSYNRSVLTRYIKDYHSIITLGRRELGNFRATQAAGGIELRWGITSGTPGGKVLIERQQLPGGDKVAVAEMKDNTLTYMDTAVDPATFIGNYYITYKGAYESSYDEKKRCQIMYIGSNSVPYCVLQEDVVTYYYRRQPAGNFDAILPLNSAKDNWSYKARKAVIDSSFDAYRGNDLSRMFAELGSITSIEGMQYLHTEGVTDMSYMFSGCSNLTSLDVTKFNTSSVTNMTFMFSSCTNLTSLDVTKFNTSSVRDMQGMFYGCYNLASLDVTRFNTSSVTDMFAMFYGCFNLKTIYASDDFVTTNVTISNIMFLGCDNLVGKVSYKANRTDASMANFDGYFTRNIPGDINGDGKVDIADVPHMVNVLLQNATTTLGRGDLNNDGVINIGDLMELVKRI